jgi:protein gp37
MRQAARIERMLPQLEHYKGLTKPSKAGPVWTGKVALASEKALLEPLRRRKPTTYFVNSMSDLFHEAVPDKWITQVFVVMMVAHHHTYQVLTKRSKRMREWMTAPSRAGEMAAAIHVNGLRHGWGGAAFEQKTGLRAKWPWPPENVCLGVSAERQQEADERIPDLLATPAAVRFVSLEPLLGPIDLLAVKWPEPLDGTSHYVDVLRCGYWNIAPHLVGARAAAPGEPRGGFTNHSDMHDDGGGPADWVIVGGESGPNARPMHPDWARSLRGQCTAAGVPFFFKQWGEYVSVSEVAGPGDHYSFPDGATVRRTGKKLAGRTLDGREWNEMPELTA